jgi:acyl-CoA synthetase (AMP-forming)/AMP-acid ligase II
MILIPQRVLGEALQRSAAKFSSRTAIIAKGKEYSYGQFKNEAENLAKYLIHAGIRKGDRIAVYMENSWQSVVSIYGATLAGAVFIVINPQTKADKLKYILNDSETKIIV